MLQPSGPDKKKTTRTGAGENERNMVWREGRGGLERSSGIWIGKKEGHMDWKEGREEKEGEGLERIKGIGIGKNDAKFYN